MSTRNGSQRLSFVPHLVEGKRDGGNEAVHVANEFAAVLVAAGCGAQAHQCHASDAHQHGQHLVPQNALLEHEHGEDVHEHAGGLIDRGVGSHGCAPSVSNHAQEGACVRDILVMGREAYHSAPYTVPTNCSAKHASSSLRSGSVV